MNAVDVGIIGGTGIGEALQAELGGETIRMDTPFGTPSSNPIVANCNGVRVAFLSRHGDGHRYNPSNVPYRANIWAMKKLGAQTVLASGAVGSLRQDIEPGDVVVCDQIIDQTYRRESTFFDEGFVVHVEFANPFCAPVRSLLVEAAGNLSARVHAAGTYVCMEGPQFSTRAESQMHRQWGGDLIGMTCMPEAKLAREAEMCYAMVAFATDYDCWRPSDPNREHKELLEEISAILKKGSRHVLDMIREALPLVANRKQECACRHALRLAFWSRESSLPPASRNKVELFLGKYMGERNSA